MPLADQLGEYIDAAFAGIWIETHEQSDALTEIAQLCRQQQCTSPGLGFANRSAPNNEPYRYARPDLMREKFSNLKLLPKRPAAKRGSPKPGLADVYGDAKLPRVRIPNQLPKGESRILDDRGLRQFVQDLYIPPAARPADKTSATKSGRPAGRPK